MARTRLAEQAPDTMDSLAKPTKPHRPKHLEVSAATAQVVVAAAAAAAATLGAVAVAAPMVIPAQELAVAARPRPQEPSSEP